ncbi:MAG: SGNH/GDSL hydrolase family protein [Planctomycetes bacterium]|nr:SGNH/GDSL hydrolase family protein [Planctomycetota bacterium]
MRDDQTPSRRDFLGASLATAGGLGLAACASPAAQGSPGPGAGLLRAGDRVLFQGDSITDAGRSRERAAEANAQAALGGGYAWFAAAGLLVGHPAEQLQVWNRGISGNKVFQLADRWQQDCLELKPDLLSILIGVNDIWHTKNGKYDGTVATYARDYDALLTRTRAALPDVRLVICEPFVLRCGAIDDSWFPEFDHYRAAARDVADRHRARWVPFQAMFDAAIAYAPPEHWAKDGVHPSAAGAALMAQTWLDVVTG